VKNGIASNSSFDTTLNSWNVRLPMKFGTIRPSSMAMKAKNNPVAARQNAAG
jgi:hypothetical protein